MSPKEAFWDIVLAVWCHDGWRRLGPGKLVEKMPPEKREALKRLTAKDLNDRPDFVAKFL